MIDLDYAETTGLHVRVGLVTESEHDDETLTEHARDLAGLSADAHAWDVNHTGAGTVEISFEAS